MSDPHALTGAYALDALDDLERARFEAHLAQCADCRDEVAGLREAASMLALTEDEAPPEVLRAKVLADIRTVRPLPPRPAVPTPATEPAPAAHTSRAPRRRLLAGVAAALVLVAGGTALAATQPWRDQPAQVPMSATERVLRAGDAESVELSFPDGSGATVTRSVSENRAVIRTHDMADAPSGRVYQLWLQRADGSMSSAGLMPAGPDHTMLLQGAVADTTGAGITVEPAGGSTQPTSEPIALFDFSEAT